MILEPLKIKSATDSIVPPSIGHEVMGPDAKSQLIGKDPDAGKDWGQEEKEATEDEVGRWHHQLNGHEFEQALEVGDGQGGLECCSPWGHKQLDMTERLN